MQCVACQGAGRDEYDLCWECLGTGYTMPEPKKQPYVIGETVIVEHKEKKDD